MKIFKNLFSALNSKSIKYMVAGGVAVNLYGIERATADIDIILRLDQDNIKKFIELVRKLGLKPKVPVKLEDFAEAEKRKEWIEDKGMKVFSLYDAAHSFFLLDVFVDVPFNFDMVYKERIKMKYGNTTIPVVPLNELIKMKQNTGRPQDKADVFYLKEILKEWEDEK